MNYTEAKKVFLKLFIGFLSLTALVAIFSVLIGEFGDIQVKILATTFTISTASICSMSCAAFIEKRKKSALGIAGIICATISAALVIAAVWIELEGEVFWKSAITFIVLSIALAHAFLLVLPDLDLKHRWTQKASSIGIGLLSLQIVGAVWAEIDNEAYYRLLAVVSIVVVLFTLVVPILMKMKKETYTIVETLVLSKNEEGTYVDKDGAHYKVTRINTEQDSASSMD